MLTQLDALGYKPDMIHKIPFTPSAALERECLAHQEAVAKLSSGWLQANFPTLEDYTRDFVQGAEGQQLLSALKPLPPGGKILDIGAGYGYTSLTMASRNFRVSVAEPAGALCELMDRAARHFQTPLDVYQVPGEDLNRLPVADFDACIFNGSLHHCDDPARALRHCHELLRPGGWMFVIHEPQLQPFRSKAWFQRQLESGTLIVGDYGGNEHIYYRGEYLDMLRQAGFEQVRDAIALRYQQPASYLRYLRAVGAGKLSLGCRTAYYRFIQGLHWLGIFGKPALALCKSLGLVQVNFVGRKSVSVHSSKKVAA